MTRKTKELTVEFVNENFYEIDGKIYRKDGKKCSNWIGNCGYYIIQFNYKKYNVHRILWVLYNQKEIPEEMFIDHIDCNRINNTKENLRLVTVIQNRYNSKINKNNTEGIKGLTSIKRNNIYYYCQIYKNYKKYSKTFPYNEFGFEQAKLWLEEKRKELHGEFARN